jgi:cobyrinic acid a,c-diamide synthase
MSLPPYLFAAIDEAKENAVKSGVGIRDGWDGIMAENTLAGYAHLPACSYLRFAEAFVDACL